MENPRFERRSSFENVDDPEIDVLRSSVMRVAPDFSQLMGALIILLILHAEISGFKKTPATMRARQINNALKTDSQSNNRRMSPAARFSCDRHHISRKIEKAIVGIPIVVPGEENRLGPRFMPMTGRRRWRGTLLDRFVRQTRKEKFQRRATKLSASSLSCSNSPKAVLS